MPRPPSPFSRRAFLAAGATSALAIGCSDYRGLAPFMGLEDASRYGGDPTTSGIEHIVLVMMENRSFDHLFGWMPHADGQQAGLTYLDAAGVAHPTYPLTPDFQGCGLQDPDHSYDGARVEYDGGACDGWLRVNDIFSIGYYHRSDLAFCGKAAPAWSSFDRYFAAILGPTFPNRLYQHAAQTDRLSNTLTLSTLPTIWDRLAAAGIDGRYYFGDVPFLGLWGSKYLPIARTLDSFFADCQAGTLPKVAFVDGPFLSEATGTGFDDHPHNDIRAGEAFLNGIYEAVTRGPGWANTLLIINFDEWGGFFDHVPPSLAPLPASDIAVGSDGRRGFRTPTILISPFARRSFTSHTLYDHTSVLRLIEWRWGLAPLTVRDASANNFADELDFKNPQLLAPAYDVPQVVGAPCASPAELSVLAPGARPAPARAPWEALMELARQHGWS
ncbi:MAG TPA: alkaline phosphatase family protein [Gemmatimonadales bacterium]|nr:alkaline phosphatase family protein [Gemmatimonadales bacterium]